MAPFSTFELYKHLDRYGVTLSTEQVKEVQSIVWSMAQEVIAICEEEQIPYMLDGGSCLGAIRHEGFIPWDDDMDISILRADYERFIEAIERRLSDRYWIHTPEHTHNYGLPMLQLRLKGTIFQGKDDFYGDEFGVPLDIFVIENTFNNPLGRWLHGFACNFVGFLQVCKKTNSFYPYMSQLVGESREGMKSLKLRSAIGKCLFWWSLDDVSHLTMRIYSLCKNDKSKYVSFPSGRKHFFGELNPRDMLIPPSEAAFEGRTVKVPNRPHEYLNSLFGDDYMVVPEESEREHHVLVRLEL